MIGTYIFRILNVRERLSDGNSIFPGSNNNKTARYSVRVKLYEILLRLKRGSEQEWKMKHRLVKS